MGFPAWRWAGTAFLWIFQTWDRWHHSCRLQSTDQANGISVHYYQDLFLFQLLCFWANKKKKIILVNCFFSHRSWPSLSWRKHFFLTFFTFRFLISFHINHMGNKLYLVFSCAILIWSPRAMANLLAGGRVVFNVEECS